MMMAKLFLRTSKHWPCAKHGMNYILLHEDKSSAVEQKVSQWLGQVYEIENSFMQPAIVLQCILHQSVSGFLLALFTLALKTASQAFLCSPH